MSFLLHYSTRMMPSVYLQKSWSVPSFIVMKNRKAIHEACMIHLPNDGFQVGELYRVMIHAEDSDI